MCGKSTEGVQTWLLGLGRNDPWKLLCCMKQSVPQASALNEYSIDVRISVFSAASKMTFFELFADFTLILVNSGERKAFELKPQRNKKSPALDTILLIIYWKMAHLILLPCVSFLSGSVNNGKSLNFVKKTSPNKLSHKNSNTDRAFNFFLKISQAHTTIWLTQ